MRTIRAHFHTGQTLTSAMAGTPDEIAAYFVGRLFNLGSSENDNHEAARVEFLDGVRPQPVK
jgi:hypothetical protein